MSKLFLKSLTDKTFFIVFLFCAQHSFVNFILFYFTYTSKHPVVTELLRHLVLWLPELCAISQQLF